MVDKIDWELHEDFKKWWEKTGYKYKPENEKEGDWYNVVKYWAWKGYRERRKKVFGVCD